MELAFQKQSKRHGVYRLAERLLNFKKDFPPSLLPLPHIGFFFSGVSSVFGCRFNFLAQHL